MNDPTRRGFLVIAGAGAAAVGAPAEATGPLVGYVTDMQRGELTLMVGERGVVVHDRDLAARSARAAH